MYIALCYNRLAKCARVAKAFVRRFVNCFKAAEHGCVSRQSLLIEFPKSGEDKEWNNRIMWNGFVSIVINQTDFLILDIGIHQLNEFDISRADGHALLWPTEDSPKGMRFVVGMWPTTDKRPLLLPFPKVSNSFRKFRSVFHLPILLDNRRSAFV